MNSNFYDTTSRSLTKSDASKNQIASFRKSMIKPRNNMSLSRQLTDFWAEIWIQYIGMNLF